MHRTLRIKGIPLLGISRLIGILAFLIVFSFKGLTHGTQTSYCITDQGKIRVWIEHWHGNISPANVTQALVSIDVTDTSTGITTNYQQIPDGVVWDTSIGNLPDCKGPMTVLSTCPGRANVYNDWVYWEFVPPACFVNLSITIVEVVGSQSWYFDEACGALYPVSFTDSFIDCVPPTISCPTNQTIEVNAGGCGANVTTAAPMILFDDCTPTEDIILTYTVTGATMASGTGAANIFYNKGTSTITYAATDNVPTTSNCSFTITIVDNTGPTLACPSNLSIECNLSGKGVLISDWLNSATATDLCGVQSITNNYDPDGFVFHDAPDLLSKNINPYTAFGSLSLASLSENDILKAIIDCSEEIPFNLQEMSGSDLFDYPVKIRVDKAISNIGDYSKIVFADNQDRLIPYWIETQNDNYADIWIKLPEAKANKKSIFKLKHGNCQAVQFSYDDVFSGEVSPETASLAQAKPIIIGSGISNLSFLNDAVANDTTGEIEGKMMACDCTATQGGVSFNINAIQNAEDDVSFFAYGTPNGASANTGLEMNDAVVLFLYENTLTGEISLFILIDDAGGGNGGRGSVDFFCLPAGATLDFSDDPGEITGIFPTVTANWRWANCCTDGALIGNVGCNTTFDFYPDFVSGINTIKWASGTLAAPVFTSFGNITDPVRIQCGMGQPDCCPNANTVTVVDATCPSSSDGSIDLVVDASGAPYTYSWSTGDTTQDLNNVLPGVYTVTVIDDNDCEQVIPVSVNASEKPELVCIADQTITTEETTINLEAGVNVMYAIEYDCTDDYTVTCVGCGSFDCADQNTIVPITLRVTDELGNVDECDINVTISNPGPDLDCPDDLEIECNLSDKGALISTWLDDVSSSSTDLDNITNNYDPVGFSFFDGTPDADYLAFHSSGKQSSYIQTKPKDYYFDFSFLTASAAVVGDSPTGSQLVTFTATDNCGNTSTCTATITIVDTEDPVITCPSDITIECGDPNSDAIIANWLDNATANDACDLGVVVTNNFTDGSFGGGCDGPTGTRIVTFTATDCDGNRSTCQASLTRDDTTPPVFLIQPTDLTVSCINTAGNTPELNAWLADNGGGIATDECDAAVTWSRVAGPTVDLCGYTFTRDYTFTITDNCGNTNTAVATFTVIDDIPPVMNAPVDRTINCNPANNDTSLAIYLEAYSANDACSLNSDITVTYIQNSYEQLCGGTFRETYLYTATDECGNTSTDLFTFEVTDVTPPTWASPPGTLVLECGDEDNPTLITEWIDAFEESIYDSCDDDEDIVIENNWDGSLTDGCNQNTVIIWTVTDGCGNSRTLSRTIAVRDTTNPSFVSCPDDFTVNVDVDECGSNVTFPTPVGFDQCTPQNELEIVQINGPASGSTFPVGTTYVRFRLRDGCNRQDLCDFFISVVDTDEPDISCPSNVEACAGPNLCYWRSDTSVLPITNENCASLTIQFEITGSTVLSRRNGNASNRNFNVGTSTVCYYLTDGAGNETECCFDVIVSDCQDPVINCPADITNAACGSTPPAAFTASATDNCTANGDIVITSMLYNTISGCGDTETQVYQFTATDEAGNTAQCFANFTTVDNTNPTITTAASAGASDCDSADIDLLAWLNNNGGAESTDGCGEVSWSYEFVGGASTGCSGAPSVNVTFTATDECGNTATTAAAFNVDDTTAPTISCPSDITLECGDVLNDSVIELWLGLASGEDNCSEVTITHDFPADPMLDCDATFTVTFTAEDECGNDAECEATITMEDVTAPTFTILPQDLILECGDPGNAAAMAAHTSSLGNAVFSDQCTDNADMTIDVDGVGDSPLCGNSEILEYHVTLTDECDNNTEATWFVHIEDTTPPVLMVPANISFACDGSGNTVNINTWLAGATATDICGTATVESVLFNSSNACGNFENQSYLFTATDECGNVATDIATVTITDTQNPVITCPADLTLSCGANNNSALVIAWLDTTSGTDVCSDVTLTNNYTGLFPANCGGTLPVTFIATDACGNTSFCMADIIMEDVITPDFENCPDDLTINVDVSNCGSNPIFSTPTAIDNCGVTVAQTTGPASGTPFPVGTTTVGFTATDECGNTTTCEFDITVVDSAEPLVLCPPDLYDRCITDGTCVLEINDIEPILGMENCPGFTITYDITGATTASGNNDASGTEFNMGVSEICYTLTDASSNSSTCCFEVQVLDCTPPTVTCPDDLTVTCDGSGNLTDLEDWLAEATATDACSTPVTFESKEYNTISGCGETYSVVYEFTGTDAAGNKSICYAQFTIEDVINPMIDTEADDLTVECDGANNSNDIQSWLNSFGGAEASDGCGEITFSHDFSGDLSDLCAETGSITVVFTATDDCGNTATTDAVFTIEDTTAPTINCPQSISLECGNPLNDAVIANWLATASATDVCSDVSFANDFETSFAAMCGESGTYTVTFTATDDCGNNTTCEGVIVVEDNAVPVFDQAPVDITIECADPNYTALYNTWIASNGEGVASDACSDVTWSHVVLDLIPSCGDAGTLPHVWTITDECGATSTAIANVVTIDNTIPEIMAPATMTVECDGTGNQTALDNWLDDIAGSDDCGDVTTSYILNNTISACGGGSEANYLFTVTDACGNTATATSSFIIEDTTVPVITCPTDLSLECGAIGNDQSINAWLADAIATDGCSSVSVTNDYDGTFPADCDGSVTVIFTATDACGNTATCEADITMDDTTDPIFVNCPDDLTINVDVDACGSNPIFSTPIAEDNCTVTVSQTAGLSSGSTFPVGVTAIEFTATDACGNTVVCQFNITVIDSDVPQIFCPSTTVTQCTDTGFCTWTSDNAVAPSTSFENCDDYTIEYTIAGATSASGSDSAAGEVFSLGLSTVCYTITDVSDNESTCCFDVLITDCEAPQIVCPNDLIVECAANNDTQKSTWLNSTVSADNCDLAATITFELFNTISDCGGAYSEQYLITATDAAGNASSCIKTFTVEDNTAPLINTVIPNVTVECDGSNNIDALIAWLANNGNIDDSDVSEYCSDFSWNNNFDQVVFTTNAPCNDDIGYYEVMFWVVDDCGNESNRITKQFIIEDTTDPTIVVPDNLTLQCDNPLNEAIISSWLLDVSATDLCDSDVVITNETNIVDQCGNTSTTTYTFTATDACGNTAQENATVVIEDNEAPTIFTPASNLMLECADGDNSDAIEAWENNFGGAAATDNCSDEDLDWDILSEVSTAGCGDIETVTYVFVVEDNCGNTSTTSAQLIITDTTDPVLTVPENQIEECGAIVVNTTDWINEATATDDCGDVTINATLVNTISDCGGTFTEIYLFTATDACGNTSTGLANYEIDDSTVPAITCPENLILECGDEENDTNIQAWLSAAISVDANNCSTTQITHDYPGGYPDPFTCNGGAGILVTFTSTDDCGNVSTCTASILMSDTEDPYFVNCPSNLIVNVDIDLCATNVIYSTPVALDNCDEMVSVVRTVGLPGGVEFPLGPTLITFEATDDCGNVSTCTFQIMVVDSDTPSIDCPSNDVEKCTDIGNCTWLADDDVDPLFNDNCSDLTLTYTITGTTSATSDPTGVNLVSEDAIVFELGTSEICYTVTDGTGNTGSCCFDVIITDCESPALFCSNDTDVACGAENVSAWFDGIAATATDNCNTNAELSVDTLLINNISSCGNTFDKTYLFTVTDEAGNTSTCIATYETDDEVAPIIDTEAQDLTIECTGGNQSIELQAWLNTNAGAAASDICSGPVTWTNDFTSGLTPSCGDNGSILVTFTATDDCGNTSTTDATFTIEDTTVPILDLPENITLECDDTFNDELIAGWLAEANAEDICDGTLTVTNDYATAVTTDLCGLTGVTTVTFMTTDACDNVTTDTRTITIEDNTNPVIEIAASDLILECADGGNDAAITAWENNNGGASATDSCSDEDLVWSILSETETVGCGSNLTTVYVFQVEDNCGNTSTTSASVSTEDNIAPVLTLPEDQIEECGNIAVTLEDWRAEVMATDDCGDVEITYVLWNTTSGCGNTDAQEYLFTATDACGNETTGIATYETEDTSTPTIVCPADLILECGNPNNDQMINVWLESATATDEYGCNDIEISYIYPGMLPTVDCTGASGITVTFTATDACGNTDECMAMIIMNDTTIPVFQTCPDDMTVNVDVGVCANNVVYSTPTAFDNCDDDLMITQTAGPASGTEFPLGTSTVTFEVEDDCGNTSECSFDITVVDTDTPSIACPSNDVVVCNDEGTCAWTSDDKTNPIFNDNCPGLVVTYTITGATTETSAATGVNIVAEDDIVFNLGTSEVCYTITDPTSNTASCCFNVVVEDCESPTITCNDQLDIACGSEDLSAWFNTIAATITDNCSDVGDMQVDTLLLTDFSSCGGTFEKVYLYTVTDEAGNTATCTATYETDDEVSPTIDIAAANLTLECNDGNQSTALQAWLNSNGGASASDICSGPVSWTNDFTNDLDATCGTNGTTDVIFTATDDCGNTSTTSATFTIEDTTSPTLALPADITLECADAINATVIENWLNGATAEDACEGTLAVANDYTTAIQTDKCGLTGVTTVTFTVTDACDNSSTDTRTITVVDNTDPVVTVEPTNLELECAGTTNDADIAAWEADFGGAEGSDSCSDEDLVWIILSETPFGNCGDSGSTLYVFQVTDNCGNTATTSASVIISDNTDPVLTVPTDIVVECNNPQTSLTEWLATATATDDCGDVTITHYLNNTISGCGSTNTEVYIFTATDACGNQMTGTANYELEDTTDPEIVCPINLILNCGNSSNDLIILEWLNSATASDPNNCSDVTITYTDPSSLPAIDCSGGGGAVITWTATDDCGNTSTCTAMIIVEDAEPPTFVNCPSDMTINVDVDVCSSNPIFSTPVADDNCSVTVMQVANASGELLASGTAFPIGTTEVVFIATDICGNTAECSFEITVEDSDVPIVLCPSNTIEVSTDPGVCTWTSDDQVATAFSVENCPDQTLVYEITGATMASGNDNAAGEIFELGLSTVCYTLTDASDNESMCCFDVLVIDEEMPMMTCPADVTISTSDVLFGDCLSDLDWTHPTITDNCSIVDGTLELAMQSPTGVLNGPTLVTSGEAVNSSFELGTTTLTYVLTDANGNITTCEWTVTVEDDEVPMITCPVDMTFEINDDCQYTETTDLLDPVTSDNCELDLLAHDYIFAPSSNTLAGASFEIGTTTVNYVVYDESGNSSTCAFDITVEDNEAPEFVNCPQDTLVVGNDVDQCSAFVNWSDPIAMDECGVAVAQTAGPNSGDELAPGFYTVTYVATDNNGNTTVCEFVIHVQDTQMPIVLCPSNDVVVDTDLGVCIWTSPEGSLTATTALTNCPFDLTWTVTNPDGSTAEGDDDVSGYVFALGTSVVCYDVIEQEDPDNNGFMSDQCCFNVIIEDNEKPLVTCQEDVVINTSAGGIGDCLANYEWNHPTPTDNCGIAMIFVTVTDADGVITGPLDVVAGENMIYDFPLGVSTIVYDIEDENGNASSCQFTVTVEDDEVPMIECVEDVVESVDENCQYVVVDNNLDPTFSDNCNINLSYHDYIFAPNSGTLAGAKFEFGETEIVWTVVDDFGNSSTCTHTVTTEDTSAPMITNCPANPIVQDADSGTCDAIVNFSNMVAEDNCGGLSTIEFMLAGELTQDWTEGQASGITYPVGITRVSYRATDQYGNVSEICEFDIEVVDNMDPVAVCQDIEIGVDFNCMATITPDDINAGSSDNCEIASLLISSDGVNFEEELTFMTEDLTDPFVVVTLQVTDEYGNISICQSTVFIVDEIDPMVICQDDIIVPTEPGVCYALVPNVVPPIDTTDNCMGIANVRQEPLPGLLFGSEVGDSMYVTVIVEDEAGNMDSCQVKLVIEDTELPQFTNCPRPPVVVAAETDLCSAAANFSVPTGTDNCGDVEITRIDDGDLDSGDWFPIGTTILEYQIEDGSGNKDTCHIKVIVNDLQPPTLECPSDIVQVNDPGECGAIVKDIDPENVTDNCSDELTVTFAVDWEGTRDNGGVIEASGEFFQVGNNVVTYCVEDRPTIVISEVTHEIGAAIGTNSLPSFIPVGDEEDYIEITNVGPSSVDVSCLVIEKIVGSTGGVGSLTLPFGTVIPTGGVMVIHVGPGVDSPLDLYYNMDVGGSNAGDAAGYALMYGECIIDVVALNGFTASGAGTLLTIQPSDWIGAIDSDAGTAGVYRPFTFDGNNNLDWAVVSDDNPGTIGKVNPDFDVYPETGLTSSLQSKCGTKVCCTFIVEIFDTEPPSIACPDDMALNTSDNGTGDCTSSTSWKHPDIDDNCGTTSYCMTITYPDGMEEENCTIAAGDTYISTFEVGETIIFYEVEDEAGNRSTCSFTITVLDDEDPTFTCPGDLFVQLGQGQCFVNVFNQINLFESDNCGDMNMVSNPDMDGQFNEGENVVTIVITDAAGNERVCSFMITVAPYVPMDTEMACQGTVNISLDADCEALITADMILTSMDVGCIDDIQVSISETHGGPPIPTSPMVNSDYLNQSLIVTLFNPDTGNSCWGTILIEDKLNPVLECPEDIIVSCATDLEPASLGAPEVMSCEESVTMVFTDEIIDNGVCGIPRAIHTRTWTVTDESGNSSTCEHTITVERLNTVDIEFPENFDDIDNPSFDCNAVAEDPLLIHPMNTGQPMIDGLPVVESSYCPLSINMDDEVFHICNGSYDILRTFRVYDPCLPVDKTGPNPNPFHYIQVIKVRDNTVPDIVCPANLVVSVDDSSCSADINFPPIDIDEACGTVDVQLITPFGSLTTNGGVISNIAIGTFSARYVVTDGCGNQTECSIDIEVLDGIEPVMVCNPDVVVSLNSTGIAEVYAEAFDQGTSDNCTLDRFEVRRMTTECGVDSDLEFGMTVTFCCADVGVPVMVQLRAYDAVGNFNECMIEVLIDDKEEAEITCPADITINCGDDFMDLTVTGSATFTDNCTGNLMTADFVDDPFIDQCGNGYVIRTWSVGTVSCTQRIDLVDPQPFVINDVTCDNADPNDGVIWPCDVEVESCDVMQDPSISGEPVLFDDNCTMVAVDYEDQVFTFVDNACFKIVRTWEVIDWCTYDSSTGEGKYSYDQVIKILNSMDPEFTSCETIEACTPNDACEASVTATVLGSDDCTAENDLTYSYQLDINNDGSFNLNGAGSSVTQTLAIGTHSILWTITDGCGNVNSCTQLINVNDCKPPTVACINGLSTSLDGGTGSIEIWAVDFNASSTDNCTATEDLIFSFSTDVTNTSATFTCSDLPNGIEQEIQVQMWVTDAYGNQSYCTTTILVQDINDDCLDVMLLEADIAGRIMTEEQIGVNQVEVNVENMETGAPYDEMSDTLGNYLFPDPMPAQFEYTIKPEKDVGHKNGITALDLISIQKHILEIDTLDSPYKLIAADINSSESITAIDLIQLQKLLLGVTDVFPNNTSWRFVNEDYIFPIPTDPWPFEEDRNIDPLMTNQMHEDFVGIKIGDVNGSADPSNANKTIEERSEMKLFTTDRLLVANKEIEIPLYANEALDIHALQFTLKTNADLLEVVEIRSEILPLESKDQAKIAKDLTTILWYDQKAIQYDGKEPIVTIIVKAKQDVLLSNALRLNSDITSAEILTQNEEVSTVRLDIISENNLFAVSQNVPNPFKEETSIVITVPEAGDVIIRVFNVLGEKIVEETQNVKQSYQHRLLSDQLGGVSGMYLYEVSYQSEVIQKNVILIN